MYAVSEAFKRAMKKPVQQHKLGGDMLVNGNRQYFTEANIQKGSFRISNQCSSNDNVEIGTVYTGELTAVFLDMDLQEMSFPDRLFNGFPMRVRARRRR